jgi:hypothetical protein
MKFALMAGIAALAFSGVAQAGDVIISETLTGHITGGSDSGTHGSNDEADLFGGLNLYNDAVSLTFSYDATALAANPSGYYIYEPAGELGIIGVNGPAPYSISVTIGGITDTIIPNYDDQTELCGHNVTWCPGENLLDTIGENLEYNYVELYAYNRDAPIFAFDASSQNDITQFLSNPDNAYLIWATNYGGGSVDFLTASLTLGSSTPEPTTWMLLAMGLGGVALLKFRRNTSSR